MDFNIEYITGLTENSCTKSDIKKIKEVNSYLFDCIKSEINRVHLQVTRRSSIVYRLINDLIFIDIQENEPVFGNTKYLLAFYSLYKAMISEKQQKTIIDSYSIFRGKSILYPLYKDIYVNFIKMVPKLNRIILNDCLYNYQSLIKYSDSQLIRQKTQLIDINFDKKKEIMVSSSTQTDITMLDNEKSQQKNKVSEFVDFSMYFFVYASYPFIFVAMFLSLIITLLIALPGIVLDYLLNNKIDSCGVSCTLKYMRIIHWIVGMETYIPGFPSFEIIEGGFFMKFPFGIIGELVGEIVGLAILVPPVIIIASLALVVRVLPLAISLVYKLISKILSVIVDSLYEFAEDLMMTGPKYH